MKKRKLEEITREITHPKKEIKIPILKESKLEEALKKKELNKSNQNNTEEPSSKKLKVSHHKKEDEEKKEKKSIKTNDIVSEELGVPISRKELKKLKKAKQKEANNEKQEALLKSTSVNVKESTSTESHKKLSQKVSKKSKNTYDRIIQNAYSGNSYSASNAYPKIEYKSNNKWEVADDTAGSHHEDNTMMKSTKKSGLSKISNWIVKEKSEDENDISNEIIGPNEDDNDYIIKNQVKESEEDRRDSAPLVTWDERLESKHEKLDRVIARESAHKQKSGEFEIEKSNTVYGTNGKDKLIIYILILLLLLLLLSLLLLLLLLLLFNIL